MTTVIGLVQKPVGPLYMPVKPMVVLATDITSTSETRVDIGPAIVKEWSHLTSQKIFIDEKRRRALAMSGNRDEKYFVFVEKFLKGKDGWREALKNNFYPEFRALNESRQDNKRWNQNLDSEILVADYSRKKGPALYNVYPRGEIVETEGAILGSGTQYAKSYIDIINDHNDFNPDTRCLELATGGVIYAGTDPNTKGLDVVAITPSEIISGRELISNEVEKARDRALRKVRTQVLKSYDQA